MPPSADHTPEAFYAHSGQKDDEFSDWQLLGEHLRAVADETHRRALEAVPNWLDLHPLAHIAGWLHDQGYRIFVPFRI